LLTPRPSSCTFKCDQIIHPILRFDDLPGTELLEGFRRRSIKSEDEPIYHLDWRPFPEPFYKILVTPPHKKNQQNGYRI